MNMKAGIVRWSGYVLAGAYSLFILYRLIPKTEPGIYLRFRGNLQLICKCHLGIIIIDGIDNVCLSYLWLLNLCRLV